MKHTHITRFGDPRPTRHARRLRREQTPAEAILWGLLRRNQFQGLHFRRQQRLGPYIADFFCDAVQLVVEVDGEVHLQQQAYDKARERYLSGLGVRVVRFSNDDVVYRIDRVLSLLAEEVAVQRKKLESIR